MFSGWDFVLISSIEWNFLWQHPQEIAMRLGRAGNRVLYVENMGVRSPGVKDAKRIAQRLKRWAASVGTSGVREVTQGVYVCSPFVMPPFGRGWRKSVNRHLLLPLIGRAASRRGMRDPVLWTHLPTDTALELMRMLRTPRSVQVYYCIADFAQLTPHSRSLRRSEEEIVRHSDLVFANSAQLAEHCKQWRERVYVFPPGVSLEHFTDGEQEAGAGGGPGGEATRPDFCGVGEFPSAPGPVIGYVGGLHKYVDIELLTSLALSRPAWSWVLVGPAQTPLGKLPTLGNVHLLGQKPHDQLARFIRRFDVCIVPYVVNDETATVMPVKINEYLSVGKPVVSTALPTVCDFEKQHGVLITAKGETGAFLQAVEQALSSQDDDRAVRRRREVAALSSWDVLFDSMMGLVEEARKAKEVER